MRRSVFLLAFLLAPLQLFAQDAGQILEQLREVYREDRPVRTEYEQTVRAPGGDLTSRDAGTLLLMGDRYRVEMPTRTMATDGSTVWILSPAEEQLVIDRLDEGENVFAPSSFLYDLDEHYEVTEVEERNEEGSAFHVLSLQPRVRNGYFDAARVWVRANDGIITRVVVDDVNRNEVTFELREVTFPSALAEDAFRIEAEDEIDVVDLRTP